MQALKHLVAAGLALYGLSQQASACSCALPPGTLCDLIIRTDVVLHVRAISRLEASSNNDRMVYTLETVEVFKAEEPGPNEYDEVGGTFEMITASNQGLCGVYMGTDGSTEYLIGINRSGDDLWAAGTCGLFQSWDEDDLEALEEGCDDYDPCDGECGGFQECLQSRDYYAEDAYYCADTCDPNPCPAGEVCILVYSTCSRWGSNDCVPEATCFGGIQVNTTESPTSAPTARPGPGVTPPSDLSSSSSEASTSSPSASTDGSRGIITTDSP